MATYSELTVGKLKHFLSAFSDDTKVVVGCADKDVVLRECHANTYYPPDVDCDQWPWVILDAGENQ